MYRRFCRCRALVLMIVILLLCVGCSQRKEYPPYYEQVVGVLGQNVETVVAEMGLTMDDFTYRDEFYWYNGTVEYLGYPFQMRFTTNNEDAVLGVTIITLYEADPEAAADAIVDMRNKLMESFGESYVVSKYTTERPGLETLTKQELLEMFAKEDGTDGSTASAGLKWILSKDLSKVPEAILKSNKYNSIGMAFRYGYPTWGSVNEEGLGTAEISLTYSLTNDYSDR